MVTKCEVEIVANSYIVKYIEKIYMPIKKFYHNTANCTPCSAAEVTAEEGWPHQRAAAAA